MTLKSQINNLLRKQDNPLELFSYLLKLWREGRTNNNVQILKGLVIDVNASEGIDFCKLGSKAIDEGFRVFDVMHVLEEALPHLNLDSQTLLEFLEKIYIRTQNDYMAHKQYKPISELVETQPKFARNLLNCLTDIDRPFVTGYISSLFQSFSRNNEFEIHKELDNLKNHKSTHVVNGVINALGNLDYKPKKNRSLIKKSFDIFDTLEKRQIDDIDASIAHALGRFLGLSKQASEKLFHYVMKNKPSIDHAISSILFLNTEEYGIETWFENLLMKLARTPSNHKGTIDNLDYVLSTLIEKKKNWNLAEKFFIKWVETSYHKKQDDKLADLFNSTFPAFANDRTCLQKFITRLLNHDSYKVHNASSELINYCNLHKLEPLKLDRSELSELELKDLLYIGRKILGYLIDSKTQSSLTLSMLDKSPRNKELQALVYSIFVNHIGQDYPGSTIDFLKQEISKSRSKIKIDLAKNIINHIEKQQDKRNSLPHIKEIIPPSQQTYRVLLEQDKIMRQAMKNERKGSFANLFKNVPLKHGSGSFSYINGDYLSVSKLSSYSTYMELPASEISHPVSAAIDRLGFRKAKRGD